MLFRFIFIFIFILLTSCELPADRLALMQLRAKMNQTERHYGSITENDCKLRGGIWRGVSNAEYALCDEIPNDAGKQCSDNYECDAFCSTDFIVDPGKKTSGTCFQTFDISGCRQGISNKTSDYPICND